MTVLVAVADDEVSAGVVDVASKLGSCLDEELYVVHLTENEYANADERQVRDDLREQFEGKDVAFEVAIEHINRSGLRTSAAVGRQLADLADDVSINHVVIGHRSKSWLGKFTEGHTALVVADGVEVPVTVVPEDLDRSVL
ncbi:universal stress protein [Natranaeroarchaeum sulfidigenes]|uniref:Nucleotide-binding protein, UspA family n=1 Tax=Natranaeroarchaeum sulfidigenes TaxID=2784880 RepID=A0A897MLB8_9EURY|nr:universal stress protein [Natranaeroarchaeum sulfidigenes]QSG02970.1 Nucleotide-binding protein, UspA family [Natranaeroarchaeum sulfidigenes]